MTRDEVVFSLDRKFRAPVVRRLIVMLVLTLLLFLVGRPYEGFAFTAAAVAAISAVTYLWRGRFKTILTHDGIKIRGYFDHFVPWADVAGFDVVMFGARRSMADEGLPMERRPRLIFSPPSRFGTGGKSSRLATVSVIRANGKRSLLRAPWVTAWCFDPEFEQKIVQMRQWQREHSVPQVQDFRTR